MEAYAEEANKLLRTTYIRKICLIFLPFELAERMSLMRLLWCSVLIVWTLLDLLEYNGENLWLRTCCHNYSVHAFVVRVKNPRFADGKYLPQPLYDKANSVLQPPPCNVTGITLKLALDQAGGVACRSEVRPERFTCSESLDLVHRLRAQADAVLIGVGTAITDNPSLLVRRGLAVPRQPLRVVIDPTLRLISSGRDHQLLTDGYPTVIYHCRSPSFENYTVNSSAVQLVYLPPPVSASNFTQLGIADLVQHLQRHFSVRHLMVEGGPRTAHAFLQACFIDRCLLVQAPIRFQDPIPSGITRYILEAASLHYLGSVPSGVDTIEYYSRPSLPWPSPDLHCWP